MAISNARKPWAQTQMVAERRAQRIFSATGKPLAMGGDMAEAGAYGQRLGSRFNLEAVPTILSRTIKKANLAVTEIRSDETGFFMTKSIPREDAFLVALQLRDFPHHQYWEDGRAFPVGDLKAGHTILYDLKRDPVVLIDKPFHSLHFYLPRPALDEIADDAEAPRIGDLAYQPGAGVMDEVMRHLTLAVAAAFARPEEVGRTFIDHIALAIGTHVAETYGGLRLRPHHIRGGLSPWQERRATEMLAARLDGSAGIAELALECGLSQRHFCRAFRQSTGLSPHAWLQHRRVDVAKTLLCRRDLQLADIAIACGFADQSHFTRVFTHLIGISPGAWRRVQPPSQERETE
ncbi:AraC family transcriptional regulator [Rhizobium tropici]